MKSKTDLWKIAAVSAAWLLLANVAAIASEPPDYEEEIQRLRDLIAEVALSNLYDVVINEIESNSPTHDTTSPDDWVEIYNRGPIDVDLSGWLVVIRGVHEAGDDAEWETVEIPSGTSIAPKGYVIVSSSGNWIKRATGELVLVAKLPDGTFLPVDIAFALGDGRIDETSGYGSVFDDFENDEYSWQRVPDGGCDNWWFLPSTCEASNVATPSAPVVFTRVQYVPRLGADQLSEYVEIINLSDNAVYLPGCMLQDRNNKGQSFELPTFVLSPNVPFRIYTRSLPQGVEGIALGRQACLWDNSEPDCIELLNRNGGRMATTSYWTDWALASVWNRIGWQPTSDPE